jgi:hypothetical protein
MTALQYIETGNLTPWAGFEQGILCFVGGDDDH